jgi:hypothetical protein
MSNSWRLQLEVPVNEILYIDWVNGIDIPCMVTRNDKDVIHIRTVTTPQSLVIDRDTGDVTAPNRKLVNKVICVHPVPRDIRDILLELDAKYQSHVEGRSLQLTSEQKRALLFGKEFVTQHPVAP